MGYIASIYFFLLAAFLLGIVVGDFHAEEVKTKNENQIDKKMVVIASSTTFNRNLRYSKK